MTLTDRDIENEIKGKTGHIYIVRNSEATVVVLDDSTSYLLGNNMAVSGIKNPEKSYWTRGIDRMAPDYMYKLFQLTKSTKPCLPLKTDN